MNIFYCKYRTLIPCSERLKRKQLDMSTSISGMLKGTACEQFHNGQARHNMFSEQMVHRINENLCSSPFSVNAWDLPMPLIRVLLGMMALKKAFGEVTVSCLNIDGLTC